MGLQFQQKEQPIGFQLQLLWSELIAVVQWWTVKNGSRRFDPNLSCIFSMLPLLFCVCLGTWDKSIPDTESELSNFLPKIIHTIILIFSDAYWSLNGEVFTKLGFGSRSKKLGPAALTVFYTLQ